MVDGELGVDLLEELLARHRRREHAERALGGAAVALKILQSSRSRVRDRDKPSRRCVKATGVRGRGFGPRLERASESKCALRRYAIDEHECASMASNRSQPPLAFAGLNHAQRTLDDDEHARRDQTGGAAAVVVATYWRVRL